MDEQTKKSRILVVEDETFLRDLYVEILADEGYEVDTAADGAEGLKKIQMGGYDLILLDIAKTLVHGNAINPGGKF